MNLSRKRLKQLLKYKNKAQSRKKYKKYKKYKKSDTFRKKIKNLRTSSLRKYKKKKVAKYKRKAYLRGGAQKNIYISKYDEIIKEITSDKTKEKNDDLEGQESKYYNFDFIFNKDDDYKQEILSLEDIREEFHTIAQKTQEEKAQEREEERKEEEKKLRKEEAKKLADKHSGVIDETTEDDIEESKKYSTAKTITVTSQGAPVVLSESTNSEVEMDNWFAKIMSAIDAH